MKRTALVLSIGMLLSGASASAMYTPGDEPVAAEQAGLPVPPAADVKVDAKPKAGLFSFLKSEKFAGVTKGRVVIGSVLSVAAAFAVYKLYKNSKRNSAAQAEEEIA